MLDSCSSTELHLQSSLFHCTFSVIFPQIRELWVLTSLQLGLYLWRPHLFRVKSEVTLWQRAAPGRWAADALNLHGLQEETSLSSYTQKDASQKIMSAPTICQKVQRAQGRHVENLPHKKTRAKTLLGRDGGKSQHFYEKCCCNYFESSEASFPPFMLSHPVGRFV